MSIKPVRKIDRMAILNALSAGVAPSRGLEHLQVGRADEVQALTGDLSNVKDGGTAVRFVVGEYGAGKSFFMQVIRQAAQRSDFVTMNADITQDSRLYGTGGRVRALHSSLVGSAGTRTQPEGGAMGEVLERFIDACVVKSQQTGGDVDRIIRERLVDLHKYRGGFEFVEVVLAYREAARRGDDERRDAVLRWLRGEYRTKTEAKQALGVSGVIGDADLYPTLRLLASLVRKAGYSGLLVEIDEMAVLSRLPRGTRDQNYEQVLSMVNSLLAGQAEHLMMVFAGTPEFVTNPTTGLYSYGALRQRLASNPFAQDGLRDTRGPVMELEPLVVEDVALLLENVHRVYCSNEQRDPLSGERDDAVLGFLQHAGEQLGGLERLTPREATRSWLQFLDVLDQNRRHEWRASLGQVQVVEDSSAQTFQQDDLLHTDDTRGPSDDELVGFTL